MSSDNPKTFMDAQLAYAKSIHGREKKRRDKKMQRYHQIKRAATQVKHGKYKGGQ
ncbi:hypothetical protein [Psychrobacter sp. ANT_WB68]|uniref:hypothetical protein n=1 Tax=Psychrobacter sp. ANT_WB68 TaxID=2597355 RepID=UPI00165E7A78|nr:hypothetical protein [Psychrobacter sp. ANT_WB68]